MKGDIYIDIDYNGIGDRIATSAIPEAFYKWYGKKLVDIKESWIFDYNPYVQRKDSYKKDLKIKFGSHDGYANIYCDEEDWVNPDVKGQSGFTMDNLPSNDAKIFLHSVSPSHYSNSICSARNVWYFQKLGINRHLKPELDIPRGPRLYKYEEPSNTIHNQIAVHVGPSKSASHFIPDYVINTIKERYSNYKIIQIGNEKDIDTPFIDKRGLEIWDSVEIIAKSAIFIGINSGPMNIANCYPHINKKLIIQDNRDQSKNSFERFEPLNARLSPNFGWTDFGWQYYNTTEHDVGRMFSYKRI
tara:strand:+ start:413 stop:1315 length:903 start_codon:yes stop_codon:yes gene_type:complete